MIGKSSEVFILCERRRNVCKWTGDLLGFDLEGGWEMGPCRAIEKMHLRGAYLI